MSYLLELPRIEFFREALTILGSGHLSSHSLEHMLAG